MLSGETIHICTLYYFLSFSLFSLSLSLSLSQAQRQDELDILSDEELEILEWDDGDGWSKGRNKQGQEGYFPRGYVKPISRPNSPTLSEASNMRRTSSLASDVISMTSAAEVAKKHNGTSTETIKENGNQFKCVYCTYMYMYMYTVHVHVYCTCTCILYMCMLSFHNYNNYK